MHESSTCVIITILRNLALATSLFHRSKQAKITKKVNPMHSTNNNRIKISCRKGGMKAKRFLLINLRSLLQYRLLRNSEKDGKKTICTECFNNVCMK